MAIAALTVALARVDLPPPARVTDDADALTLQSLVREPMLRWQAGRALPGLIAAWSCDPQARRWRFVLRAGARFHDGAPLRPGDLIARLEAARTARDGFGMRWAHADYLEGFVFSEAGGALIVEGPAPLADLPEILTEFFVSREDAHGRPILGTGPWRVAALAPDEAVLERPGGAPARLRLVAIPDAGARLEALRAGRVDIAAGLEQVPGPPPDPGALGWASAPGAASVMAYLQCRAGPFADPRLRRAANLAVDRARIVQEIHGGRAIPARTVVSPAHLGHAGHAIGPIPHDPQEARRLVAAHAAEHGAAPAVLIRAPTHMPDRAPALAEAVARDLAAAGFVPRLEIVADRPAYARAIGAGETGDLALFDSTPHVTYRVLRDKILSAPPGPWWQGHADPQTDRLMARAWAEPEEGPRAALYAACLRRLQADPPWLYLVHPVAVVAARPGISAPRPDALGALWLP